MKPAISIPENVRYIESFGTEWVRAVLLREVDLSFLEENRRAVAAAAGGKLIRGAPPANEPVNLLTLHFAPGESALGKTPEQLLKSFFRGSSHEGYVQATLARAKLTEGDLRWRTEMRDGIPSIAGDSRATFNALGALAHELGHCLYESELGRPGAPTFEVESEAAAMALEEWVVDQALPVTLREPWRAHQRRLDRLNQAFDAMERSGLTGAIANRHLIPLRATYYTAYGYQAVYREASRLRSLGLATKPHSVDEVLRAILSLADPVHGAVEPLG